MWGRFQQFQQKAAAGRLRKLRRDFSTGETEFRISIPPSQRGCTTNSAEAYPSGNSQVESEHPMWTANICPMAHSCSKRREAAASPQVKPHPCCEIPSCWKQDDFIPALKAFPSENFPISPGNSPTHRLQISCVRMFALGSLSLQTCNSN